MFLGAYIKLIDSYWNKLWLLVWGTKVRANTLILLYCTTVPQYKCPLKTKLIQSECPKPPTDKHVEKVVVFYTKYTWSRVYLSLLLQGWSCRLCKGQRCPVGSCPQAHQSRCFCWGHSGVWSSMSVGLACPPPLCISPWTEPKPGPKKKKKWIKWVTYHLLGVTFCFYPLSKLAEEKKKEIMNEQWSEWTFSLRTIVSLNISFNI